MQRHLVVLVAMMLSGPASAVVSDAIPTGPAIGETMPAFALKDQNGEIVDYSPDDGKGQALILFYRSASW